MSTVLITGGAGFIGSNFVHYYAKNHPDDTIVVLDKLTYCGNLENIISLVESGDVEFIKADIGEAPFISNLFNERKFDIVFNFAAETHVDKSIEEPFAFTYTNIHGTQVLLEAAKANDVKRFIQISTDEVYGDLGLKDLDSKFTENTKLHPSSPYSASKAAADLLALSYFRTFGMPVIITRCSNNYGPYQYPEKLIPYFFRLASDDQKVPLYGDGLNVRDWLYVEDHCSAVDEIAQKGKLGEVYNIGGDNQIANIEITKMILKFLNKKEDLIEYVQDRPGHDQRYAIDATKLETDVGWKPKFDFEHGIEATLNWYKENTAWWEGLLADHNRIK